MPSMSYCACQNTREELANCLDVLNDNDYQVYSEDEFKAVKQVIQMAKELVENESYLQLSED